MQNRWLLLLPTALVVSGCGSATQRAMSRQLVAGTSIPVAAPALTALPAGATFAWLPPTSVLGGATEADDLRSFEPDVAALREEIDLVLRSRSWQRVNVNDAQYHLMLALIDRPDNAVSPADGNGRRVETNLPRCTGANGERSGVTCSNDAASPRAGSRDLTRRAGAWLAYVIRRQSDGATMSWDRRLIWDMQPADMSFARPTLALFSAADAPQL